MTARNLWFIDSQFEESQSEKLCAVINRAYRQTECRWTGILHSQPLDQSCDQCCTLRNGLHLHEFVERVGSAADCSEAVQRRNSQSRCEVSVRTATGGTFV